MKKILTASIFTALLSPMSAAIADIVVDDIQLTKRERVSRFDFRYEFDVKVTNTSDDAENILAAVRSANPALDVSQSFLSLSALAENDQQVLEGKLVLIQDRRVRFNENDLIFDFSYDLAEQGNEFEQTFAENSAYITGQHTNFFVESGLATQEQVDGKIQGAYAQLFDLVPFVKSGDSLEALAESFTDGLEGWLAFADNGTNPTVALSVRDEMLVVSPTWNAPGDAIAVKFQQFLPVDFTHGGTISYQMEVDEAYAADGNMAVQLILEDQNYNPAFFAYRGLNQGGPQTIALENIGPDSDFGYVAEGFDFTKVAGIGFQFLANAKAADVGGEVYIDEVNISVALPPAEPQQVFNQTFDSGIANWNVQLDNGSSLPVNLSHTGSALNVSPIWDTSSDAFTVKYQQFSPLSIEQGVTISFDVKLPTDYLLDGSLAIQLVVEDVNYNPGFTGYASVAGQPGDEYFTLTFEGIGPDTSYGYISDNFDFNQLAGIGLQFIAAGKPVAVSGEIQIDNVSITAVPAAPVIESDTSVLFATEDELAFIKSIDSDDIRSEGMSYGMMIAVMMDDQQTFDKLWSFSKLYMQNKSGDQKDFFAWRLDANAPYAPLDVNPAPDGEEYFAMALFFANNRWGSDSSEHDYQTDANDILHDMLFTQTPATRLMFNPLYQHVEFVTVLNAESFTDPSYHLPAFYELWALWADENNEYWHQAAAASRLHFELAAHPVTGLYSDYTTHDGQPKVTDFNPLSHKSAFDSYRVIGNIAMDYHWFSQNATLGSIVDNQVDFFESEINTFGNFIAIYDVDGTREPGITFRGEGRNAMNGYGATASDKPFAREMLRFLWEQQPPRGEFRYYDGMLYLMSLMHASGDFKIYKPQ